jgi:hypothetical protein
MPGLLKPDASLPAMRRCVVNYLGIADEKQATDPLHVRAA